MRRLISILLLLGCALWGGAGQAAEINLSVAASMTDAVNALIVVYRSQVPEVDIRPNFAASGSLARQVAQGAPADLFISANPKWMDYLVAEKRVPAGNIRILAGNELVLVGKQGLKVTSLADLAGLGRIALGSPRSVPAGQYAVQALQNAGVFARLQGHLVMARDVRQALAYADRGEVDGAFVYRTDALLARHAGILLEVPQDLYDRVRYPMALTVQGAKKPAAVAFAAFLRTPAAGRILDKFGFVVP